MDLIDYNAQAISLELSSFQKYFDFKAHPFAANIDGSNAILLADQTIARNSLRAAIDSGDNVIVFTGPAGIGKTVIVDHLIAGFHDSSQTVKLVSANLTTNEQILGIIKLIELGRTSVRFIIDDAANLAFETIRDLSNVFQVIRSEGIKTQTIFVGRPHFLDTIAHPKLRAFYRSINSIIALQPMQANSIQEYLAMRLNLAGSTTARAMTPRAGKIIAQASHGIPGTLNLLAIGSLKNAVYNKHNRVKSADALLAVRSPNMSPGEAYGWMRKNRSAIIWTTLAIVVCSAGGFAATKPWFDDDVKAGLYSMRVGVATAIDFFSDHSAQESPQIPLIQSTDPVRDDIDPKEAADQKAQADNRSRLIDQLDRESRRQLSATESNPRSMPDIVPNIIADKPKADQTPIIPTTPAPTVAVAPVPPSSTAPTALRSATTVDAVQEPLKAPSVMAPVVPPIADANAGPAAPAKHSTTVNAAPTTHAETRSLPSFCSRMHPETEAGKEYMRRVCVKGNRHGDMYYGQK